MLETTLSTSFVPGTNLTGGLACASWRFLLPSLHLEKILCLGIPPAATLSVLSTMSDETIVVSTDARQLEKVRAEIEQLAIPNVRTAARNDFSGLPNQDKSVSLVLLNGGKESAGMLHEASLLSELGRLLKDDGVVYFEIKNLSGRFAARKALKMLASLGFKTFRVFWLTPFGGELRTAFPLGDNRMAGYLFMNVLYGQSFKKRTISRAGVWLSQARLLSHIARRRAVLIQRSPMQGEIQQPPHYLVSLAGKAGVDLSGLRCGLSARGKYNANKTIFYLFDKKSERPELVVKMTRAAEFNYRLENEYRVLSLLHEKGFVDRGTFPEPLFFGYHENLAILGQKAVHGEPFRARTKATVDCPIARDAIAWIVRLGTASSEKSAATAAQVGEALNKLFRRFAEIYDLSRFDRDFLTAQIATISHASGHFPLVFQHGDPGTWNILVSEQGKVIILDWEAGEPHGMPLWDFFYFMRTFGSWISRVQGVKDPLQNFTRNFLEPSALSALLAEKVACYRAHIGLDDDLIEPLFHTCWMHRALKESTRLPKADLQKGTYFNLLRRCIERRNAPALKALFAAKN
jgi:aminoglycoside phosphotransferase (APT) family kinase protein